MVAVKRRPTRSRVDNERLGGGFLRHLRFYLEKWSVSTLTGTHPVSPESDSKEYMAMKRLLKDGSSGLFFDGNGGWTAEDSKAHHFKDASSAIRAFQKLKMANILLILKFEDSRFDVATPLGNPELPPSVKHIKPQTIIMGTVLPVAMEAIKAASCRM